MKNFVIISTFFILATACHNNSEHVIPEGGQSRPKLSPCIEDAFAYYIKHEENPDTSTMYLMEFLVGESGFPLDDTLICFYECHNRHLEGLKGIMTIGKHKVLVLDKQNVGGGFYNVDSLMDTDINKLCISPSEELILCCAFVLDGGSYLELLGCQPDDFEPIKIDRE